MKLKKWPETISAGDLSAIVGVTTERLRQFATEGIIERVGRGVYRFPEVLTALYRHQRDAAARGHATDNNDRVKVARAREIELRIAQRERELIALADAEGAMRDTFGALRSELEGVAAAATRDRQIKHRIEDLIAGALTRASDRIAEFARSERAAVSVDDKADGARD